MRSLAKFVAVLALCMAAFAQVGTGPGVTGGGTANKTNGNSFCFGAPQDTGVTRSSALTLNIGTCTAGNATGTLNLTTVSATNGLFGSGAGAGRIFLGGATSPIPIANGEEIIANPQTAPVASGSQLMLQPGWSAGQATVLPSTAATAGAITVSGGAITAIAVSTAGLYPFGMFAAGGSGPSVTISGCSTQTTAATIGTVMDVTNGTTVASFNIVNGGSYTNNTGCVVTVTPVWYLQMFTQASVYPLSPTGATAINSSTGNLSLWSFSLSAPINTSKIAYLAATADASADTFNFGIYCDQAAGCGQFKNGALICQVGAQAGSSIMTAGSHDLSWSSGPFYLPPAKYLFAFTQSGAVGTGAIAGGANNSGFSLVMNNTSIANSGGAVLPNPITPPSDSVASGNLPAIMLH